MSAYSHILLALDLSPDSPTVGKRAAELAKRCDAQLTLLHVTEYLPTDPTAESLLPDVGLPPAELMEAEKSRLREMAQAIGFAEANCLIRFGSVKQQLIETARELAADLIVIGRHERHGLAVLFGHTEDAVLHGAPCDVLAVLPTTHRPV